MTNNIFIKLLTSIPVILLVMYFLPFIGICLLIFRYIISYNKRKNSSGYLILLSGIILLIPKAIEEIFKLLKLKLNTIPYIEIIINNNLYNTKLISFSKLLIIVGIIFIIVITLGSILSNKLGLKAASGLRNYLNRVENEDKEIREKNNLKMQMQREEVKNTHLVHCPHCGSDNTIKGKTGKCKYCRQEITFNA